MTAAKQGRAAKAVPEPVADGRARCAWAKLTNPLYVHYHDTEWGVPEHDDRALFEKLVLDGHQAGLSWETILNKRENYRLAFDGFVVEKVARYTPRRIERLLLDAGLVRNRQKMNAAVSNARAFLKVQQECGSFDRFLWDYVGGVPVQNQHGVIRQVQPRTELSDTISNELRRRGFKFVGSTIVYAYMQAIGMVNDHLTTCFRHAPVRELARRSRRT
ncbi:MAG: DNA-3-methyladenine glycosylase I [Candidatus Eisenbacteria bacterium]